MNTVPEAVKASQFLYRLRDADGALLYVGVTTDWPARMKQHQADKPWWSEVLGVELVRMDCTRRQIEAIEKAVIKTEAPTYNVVHNGKLRRTLATPGPFTIKSITRHDAAGDAVGEAVFTANYYDDTRCTFHVGEFVHTSEGRGAILGWWDRGLPGDAFNMVVVALSDGPNILVDAKELADRNPF